MDRISFFFQLYAQQEDGSMIIEKVKSKKMSGVYGGAAETA